MTAVIARLASTVPLLLIVFSSLTIAVPHEASAATDQDAIAAFDEAKKQFRSGNFAEAAAAFRKAYALKPSWKIFYNIGQSESAAKHYGVALEAFERYLAEGGDEVAQARRDELLIEVERLRKMVGSVEVVAPEGAIVVLEGAERGTSPLPGPVMIAAGMEQRIVVMAAGKTLLDRMIRVSGGQSIRVEVSKEKEASPLPANPTPASATAATSETLANPESSPSPAETPAEPRNTRKIVGWTAIGVGGALLIGGGATGGAALKLNGQIKDNCPNGACPASEEGTLGKRDALAIASDVMLGGGVAVAVVGALLLTVFRKDSGDEEQREANAATWRVLLGPTGVTVGGGF